MSNFERVKKFMKTFGQEIKEKAEFPDNKITTLRYDLIKEELSELKEAINKKDLKEDTDSEVEVSKEEERTAANDEAVLKSGGNEELQRKLKNAEVELAETRKKLEKQIQRCECS